MVQSKGAAEAISGIGDQLGAVCQGEVPKEVWGPDTPVEDADWDVGIAREGAIAVNDQELNEGGTATDPVGVVGVGDPCAIPSPFAGADVGLGALGIAAPGP